MANDAGGGDADWTVLLAQASRGDDAAFTKFFENARARLQNYANRIIGNEHNAEDLVAEALDAVWENLDKFDPDKGTGESWTYKIVENKIIDFLRKKGRARDAGILDAFGGPTELPDLTPTSDLGPHESLERDEDEAIAKVAFEKLAKLHPDYHQIIKHKQEDGWSYARIADEMGLTPGAVRGRYRRAKKMFGELEREVRENWRKYKDDENDS